MKHEDGVLDYDDLQAALEKPLVLLKDRRRSGLIWFIALNSSLVELQKLLNTAFPGEPLAIKPQHTIDLDADPFIPDGWRVEEHKKGGQLIWDPAKIKLYLSGRQQNGKWLKGHELRQELASKPVLNANVLDYLLAHPELIPEECKGKYIYFWGTIHCDSCGHLCVRFLYFGEGQWRWSHDWLGDGWDGGEPAALLAPSTRA